MKYLKTKQLRVLDAGNTPRSVESSSEQGWKQGIQGAVVAWGEVHRRAISCSDVFHKGPLPNGDADLEHCTLSFSTGNLKLTVIVGLLLVKIMNLRRVQSDAQYLLREVKFHWRKAFQPAFPWCLCWCPYFTDGEAKARRSEPASPVRQLAVSNCGS